MGTGFGKVILFGEHFVVHGCPAIAASVSKKVTATAKKNDGEGLVFLKDKDKPSEYRTKVMDIITKQLGVDSNLNIEVETDIPIGAGMGSSAAFVVALTEAVAEANDLTISRERVCGIAFECEKIAHGTPSGIDNTAATYGGLIWFQKKENDPNIIQRLSIEKPLLIAIGYTGKKGDTKELVSGVRQRKESDEKWFAGLLQKEKDIVLDAKMAFENNDLVSLGKLMNENQVLLNEIGVSTDELDAMCKTALNAGALGAKLTGAGGGGCMIALAKDSQSQKEIVSALKKSNYTVFEALVGVKDE